jgi:hypothetical protein
MEHLYHTRSNRANTPSEAMYPRVSSGGIVMSEASSKLRRRGLDAVRSVTVPGNTKETG